MSKYLVWWTRGEHVAHRIKKNVNHGEMELNSNYFRDLVIYGMQHLSMQKEKTIFKAVFKSLTLSYVW